MLRHGPQAGRLNGVGTFEGFWGRKPAEFDRSRRRCYISRFPLANRPFNSIFVMDLGHDQIIRSGAMVASFCS